MPSHKPRPFGAGDPALSKSEVAGKSTSERDTLADMGRKLHVERLDRETKGTRMTPARSASARSLSRGRR